ncbi:hypothetical protein HQ403_00535 [Candidatus Kaiserbacteria bacterium]|nr:hypothetical protein [Candidatus Kaiserbacteria bacterium]
MKTFWSILKILFLPIILAGVASVGTAYALIVRTPRLMPVDSTHVIIASICVAVGVFLVGTIVTFYVREKSRHYG